MIENYTDLYKQFENHFQKLDFLKNPDNLFIPLQHAFKVQGKRLRPLCCLIINEAFTLINEDSLTIATALELFHNFTLIHDDIIDKATLRRGKPTVFHKYGLNSSILSGDALLILAYQQIEKISNEYKADILLLFNKTAIEVCLGQQLDIDLEHSNTISIDEYINMIRLKTAVLIGCSFKMGGILARLSDKQNECLYHIGENLGIAFQIQDDILDIYGDPEKTGKKNSTDIINAKKTFLFTEALSRATPSQLAVLNNPDAQTHTEEHIARILNIFDELKIKEKSKIYLEKYYQNCLYYLEKLEIPNPEAIRNILNRIMGRTF